MDIDVSKDLHNLVVLTGPAGGREANWNFGVETTRHSLYQFLAQNFLGQLASVEKTPPQACIEIVARRGTAADVKARFQKLVAEWRASRNPFASDTSNMVMPEYQQIIGLGPDAVPLILGELESEVDDWFWALRAISGEDPVPEEHLGDAEAMRKDWLHWGAANGYTWGN